MVRVQKDSALADVRVTAAKRGLRQQQQGQVALKIRFYLMMSWRHTSVIMTTLKWERKGWR
jgi:hypothetical protein